MRLLFLLFLPISLFSQTYLEKGLYTWTVEKDLVYAHRTNYVGETDTLLLDLYKPVGNFCPERPLVVLVHGGSWLTGCKEGISWFAEEMVSRGYVVANVNYRLGWHKKETLGTACGTQDFPDIFPNSYAALYPADSCEMIRAIYRGQQDVKSAIRWLKSRHMQDSTSQEAILVGGESAGAFLSLAVGFLDKDEEKPACCFDLIPAPEPSQNMLNMTTLNCQTKIWQIDSTARMRSDLGTVDGTDEFGGLYDANILGVISLYGGLPLIEEEDSWLAGPDTPAVFLYHQTCDAVVPFGTGKPFYPISGFCNGFGNCAPWHHNAATVMGNGTLADLMENSGGFEYETDFTNCAPFDFNLGLISCLYFGDNGAFHFTANRPLRAEKIAAFFYEKISEVVGMPCASGLANADLSGQFSPAPNPFSEVLGINCSVETNGIHRFRLYTAEGRLLVSGSKYLSKGWNVLVQNPHLTTGMYILQLIGPDGEVGGWPVLYQKN